MATLSHLVTILAVAGAVVSLAVLIAVWASTEVFTRYKAAQPTTRAAFALAVVLAALYGGTKSAGSRVNYPQTDSGTAYLTDAGSSVTNDAVVLNFTRSSLVPDDAWLFLDACPLSVTNAADVAANCVTVYSNRFSAISLPLTVAYENATNYVWYAYTDWTPGPVVHTNGVVNVAWLKAKGEMPPNAVRVVPLRTEVNPIPAPYDSKVEYLESSGTQFVDTGLILSSDGFAYDADFLFVSGGDINQIVFGGRTHPSFAFDDSLSLFWTGALPYQGFRFDYFGNGVEGELVEVGIRYSISCSQGTTTVNGVAIPTPVTAGRKGKVSTYIFAAHRPDATGGIDCPSHIRLYSMRLFQAGVKVADYTPVRKAGIGYLYDSVSGKLFGNEGSGSFVIGPDTKDD